MKQEHPILDMTLEGEFVSPRHGVPPRPPVSVRFALWATVTAVIAASVAVVLLTLWFVAMMLPFIIGAAVVAYAAHRYQLWRFGNAMTWRPPGR